MNAFLIKSIYICYNKHTIHFELSTMFFESNKITVGPKTDSTLKQLNMYIFVTNNNVISSGASNQWFQHSLVLLFHMTMWAIKNS